MARPYIIRRKKEGERRRSPGYYDENFEKIFYKKKIVTDINNTKPFTLFARDSDADFVYLERVEAGRVQLYKRVEQSGSPGTMGAGGTMTAGTNTTTNYYYAEKEGLYKNVFITGLRDKSDDFNALKSFIDDDPEVLKTLESDEFHLNEKNILRLVRAYNLKHFQKVAASEYKTGASASFYTRVRAKIKDNLTISINDSLQLKLPVSKLPLPVNLPAGVPSKFCVTYDGTSSCTIIAPSPFAINYYELDFSANDKSFEADKKTLEQFKSYLASVLKN